MNVLGYGFRILVVDDDPDIQRFLGRNLSDLGFEVEIYKTLASISHRCVVKDYDIILIEENLYDGSGLLLCEHIQEQEVDCALVLMSGYADFASTIEAIRLNVSDYLIKPIYKSDLVTCLGRVVKHLQLSRQNQILIEELKQKNRELASLMVRDSLTQLYNHGYLQQALKREIARSERHGIEFSVAMVDFDRFRVINESLGHLTGDQLLREFGSLLLGRGTKGEFSFRMIKGEIAARYGGDVFGFIFPETSKAGAVDKLESLRHSIKTRNFHINNIPIVTLSIGLATFPEDARDGKGLIMAADTALSMAKYTGGDRVVGYSTALGNQRVPDRDHETIKAQALGRSLANGFFDFVYQPIVDVEQWSVYAYEALCRPTDREFVDVKDLLRTAVRSGRVCDLGRILRKLALRPLPYLDREIKLFINIHPQDLNDPQLFEIEPEIKEFASRIVFEVTETQEIEDFGRTRDQIHQLRSHGFKIALDDLGSGYSGLNSLASLEPNYVKLDMELIRGIKTNSRAARLIEHIIEYCEDEQLATIAEGIETEDELDVVVKLGLKYVQGFLTGRPSPPFCQISQRPSTGN